MNKDLDYNYIAHDIAKELANTTIYDEQKIAEKIKAILKASITREQGDRKYSELVIRCHRQSIALNRRNCELEFWKSKIVNKEQYFNELSNLLKQKGIE
jgi:hypothetical protein